MPMASDIKATEIKTIKPEDYFKIFFNHSCNSGVVYYRMINFANYMQEMPGVSLAYSKFDAEDLRQKTAKWEYEMETQPDRIDDFLNSFNMLMGVSDISVWQYIHTRMGLSLFLTYRNSSTKPILVEIDDDVFNVDPSNLGAYGYRPDSDAEYYVKNQIMNAHGVICSTPWLAKQIKKHNPFTWVIPNSIDFKLWDNLKKPQRHKNIRLGWAGSDSHDEDLKIIKQIMPEILRKHKNVEFYFYGGFPKGVEQSKRVIFDRNCVNILKYPQALKDRAFDIGLAPLKDNFFNRSKSNLRYLEYSAMRIPTVASPVEPFEVILNGSTGITVWTPAEWIEALDKLILDYSKRKAMGMNAYNFVKDNYNAEITAKKYVQLLQDIQQGKEKINTSRYEDGALIV